MIDREAVNLQEYILSQGVFNKTKFKVVSSSISASTESDNPEFLLTDGSPSSSNEVLKGFDLTHLLRTTLTTDKYIYTFFMRLQLQLENVQDYNHCEKIERILLYPSFSLDKQIIENYSTSVKAINGNQELHDVVMWLVDCPTPAEFKRDKDSTLIFVPYDSIQRSLAHKNTLDKVDSIMKKSHARRGLMNREIQMRYALVNHFNEILRSEKYKEGRDSLLGAIFHASQTGVQNTTAKMADFINNLS